MRGPLAVLALFAALTSLAPAAPAQKADWAGRWLTTKGVLNLSVRRAAVKGTYGDDGSSALEGTHKGRVLEFTFRAGRTEGEGRFELDASGHFFTGKWSAGSGGGSWTGWREDPKAAKGKAAKLDGAWRTSWGLLELEQRGTKLKGGLGAQGWTDVDGQVRGRRLELSFRAPWGAGKIWGELRADGALYGGTSSGSGEGKWIARRLEGYDRPVKPVAGEIVAGLGENRLTYYLRAPKGYRKGKPVPAIVFLHGSNMSSRPYLETIAQANDFGDRFMIIGIDGESWQDWSEPDDPRHNYTYVNWMGRSTYQGYPNTHRESPALVAELVEELRKRHKLSKVLVGGHSQGGFLSYFMLMHYPEAFAGVFPISCGLVIQCEPDVFEDKELLAAQRATPLAAVHGRSDSVVAYTQGEAAFRRFEDHGFPSARLFDNRAGHGFAALPFDDAIDWLDRMSAEEPEELIAYAQERLGDEEYADVCALVQRLRGLKLKSKEKAAVTALAERVDKAAGKRAAEFAEAIEGDTDGAWVDEFAEWRGQFEHADAAAPAMAAYAKLREKHEEPAQELYAEARQLNRGGDRAGAKAKYQKLVDDCYASSLYRRVSGWLANWR